MNKSAYDLSSNGGLSKLKEKLIEQLPKKKKHTSELNPYQPRKLPNHADL